MTPALGRGFGTSVGMKVSVSGRTIESATIQDRVTGRVGHMRYGLISIRMRELNEWVTVSFYHESSPPDVTFNAIHLTGHELGRHIVRRATDLNQIAAAREMKRAT